MARPTLLLLSTENSSTLRWYSPEHTGQGNIFVMPAVESVLCAAQPELLNFVLWGMTRMTQIQSLCLEYLWSCYQKNNEECTLVLGGTEVYQIKACYSLCIK